MIFVSTGGFRALSLPSVIKEFMSCNINNIELSGGLYSAEYESLLLDHREQCCFQIHNYFPPPENPFVLNLASPCEIVAGRSIKHVENAIGLAKLLGRPKYSFHAGFRVDPRVTDLGRTLTQAALTPREDALTLFRDRILRLAKYAEKQGVELLIENNVINVPNFKKYGEDPLLLTEPIEIEAFMSLMPDNVRLLLDVAHLKVSAETKSFDLFEAHEKLKPWIRGYHLSENDGKFDTNEPLSTSSWFWGSILKDLDYYSVEVYGIEPAELSRQMKLVQKLVEY